VAQWARRRGGFAAGRQLRQAASNGSRCNAFFKFGNKEKEKGSNGAPADAGEAWGCAPLFVCLWPSGPGAGVPAQPPPAVQQHFLNWTRCGCPAAAPANNYVAAGTPSFLPLGILHLTLTA
jgi:hypothetical protein